MLLGIHGLAFYAQLPRRLPSIAEWSAAGAQLARDARPGDAVVLEPWWAERARQILPSGLPIVAAPAPSEDDLPGIERLWFLSMPGAPGSGGRVPPALAARSEPIGPSRSFGALELTARRLRAPVVPLAFLPDLLSTAVVTMGDASCTTDWRGAFRCRASPRTKVASEIRDVGYAARRCVVARVDPAGPPLTIAFPNVAIGRLLRGHAGIAGETAFEGDAMVEVVVKIDGDTVGRIAPPGAPGWHPFEIDSASARGRKATISFTVVRPDARRRDLCFDAYTLP